MAAAAAEPVVSMAEAPAYVRIETGEEEAVLAALIRTASSLCEAFLNKVVVARGFAEEVAASASWQRLACAPVRSIASVEAVSVEGIASVLPPSAYGVDIDASGDGWVRVTPAPGLSRVRVSGLAGTAASANEVPEPIRQGVLRLVAHLYASRDGGGGEPPAAVTALWRPYRRMRLA
jgi:uncharacterized phiE125 gp8 family phage protein